MLAHKGTIEVKVPRAREGKFSANYVAQSSDIHGTVEGKAGIPKNLNYGSVSISIDSEFYINTFLYSQLLR